MITVAGILLAIATLITLLVAQLVGDAHPVGGADAMGLILVIPVLIVQWLVLAGAVVVAAKRMALHWIHPSKVVQAIVALLWLAALGISASSAVLMAYGPDSDAIVPWAFALAVAVPTVCILGTALSLRPTPVGARGVPLWRLGALVVTLVAGAGAARMIALELASERAVAAAIAQNQQERAQFDEARRRAFEALAPTTAPLRDVLPWLQLSDEVGRMALTVVRARPTLEADVAAMLRSEDAPEALQFMWLWMPDPPETLAVPARDAIATLPAWSERWLSAPPRPSESSTVSADPVPALRPADLSDMAQAAIVIADKFRSSGLDFETPIAAFSRALERHALPEERLGEDRTYQPRAYLRTWLDGRSRPTQRRQ